MDLLVMLEEERELRKKYEKKKADMEQKVNCHKSNERCLFTWIILKSAMDKALRPFMPTGSLTEESTIEIFKSFLASDCNHYKKGRHKLLECLKERKISIETYVHQMGFIMFFCNQFASNYQQHSFIEGSAEEESVTLTSSLKELTDNEIIYVKLWKQCFKM